MNLAHVGGLHDRTRSFPTTQHAGIQRQREPAWGGEGGQGAEGRARPRQSPRGTVTPARESIAETVGDILS